MISLSRPVVLTIIALAQFFCTSLWFAGNAVIKDMAPLLGQAPNLVGNITSAVQLGFILGTLVFAFLSIADRFSPTKVFLVCALLGAFFNLFPLWNTSYFVVLVSRGLTGFMLAGIYPVGMKIAADYHEKGLGKALGFLVGALVLGTGFPHMLSYFTQNIAFEAVFIATSTLAVVGGMGLGLLPDGPYRTSSLQAPKLDAVFNIFTYKKFRRAAFGYFGHMWELYTFWAFLPAMIYAYQAMGPSPLALHSSLLSFLIIASGFFSCVWGGFLSLKTGSARVAMGAQVISLLCCLLSPLSLYFPPALFLFFLLIWGLSVIADSPQFSTLVAQHAPAVNKGTALTITNSIGFAITIISIQLLEGMKKGDNLFDYLPLLGVGPLIGLVFFYPLMKARSN